MVFVQSMSKVAPFHNYFPAFMITREEYPNLSGVDDHRLSNPTSVKPPFKFGKYVEKGPRCMQVMICLLKCQSSIYYLYFAGTIPNGATDYVIKNNFPGHHAYMKQLSKTAM